MYKITANFFIRVILISIFLIITTKSNVINAESSLSKYNKEVEEIKQNEKQNIKRLSGIEKEIAQYNFEIADIDSKMAKSVIYLSELEDKKEKLDNSYKRNEELLKDSSKIYEELQSSYAKKLKYIYENGMPNVIDFWLNAKDILDFIAKMSAYENILEYNKEVLNKVKSKKNYVEYIKNDIENQKIEIEQLENDIKEANNKLSKELQEKQVKVNSLQNSENLLKSNSEELIKQKEEALNKIDDEIRRVYMKSVDSDIDNTQLEFTGGNFAWPVPGYNIITTTFGFIYYMVNPNGSPHTGCDVAGVDIFGKKIVAIESGTVIVAGYNEGGYGNFVMIDHGKCTDDGNNYISVYGHASALAVSTGDVVKKGQTIAYVGSTGNSTGPHLHLEIRVNGIITDPLIQYPALTFDYR